MTSLLEDREMPLRTNVRPRTELEALCQGKEFDIIVVGAGGSGSVSAIEATDLGGSVLVLEKTSAIGGSTQESHGTLRRLTDREGAIEHYVHLAEGTTPREVMEAFVDGVLSMPEWFAKHGGEIIIKRDKDDPRWVFPARRVGSAYPGLPGSSSIGVRGSIRATNPGREGGEALIDLLSRNMEDLKVPVVVDARVTRLLQEFPSRRVVGVEVDNSLTIRARKGVILCCGGFAWDHDLMRQIFGHAMPALSPPKRNTGDGIRLAQDVGADLWHMSGTSATVGYQFPELAAAFHCRIPTYGFMMVDQLARRYACETDIENHAAAHIMLLQDLVSGKWLRVPSFVIFDENSRLAGPVAQTESGENRRYRWSEDNSVEIERGWIERADSIEQLAGVLGLPPQGLLQTIDAFNAAAASGNDPLGRTEKQMREIVRPPYYGAPVYPSLLNTQGGPRRNAKGAILRPDGSVIPGLFGAGELGSIWNRLYPGAGNVSETIVSGRLAARSALNAAAASTA
jgi:succinate dehydrogenase/fumarate reductase flavoprotein subunit